MITIESQGKNIILFGRENRKPTVKIISNFAPYFYVEDENGLYKSVLGKSLKKINCKVPYDVTIMRENYSNHYEADIRYTNRYIINEIDEIKKEEIRICYLDIETRKTSKGYESVEKANNPIASITCYDNFDKEYKTFYGEEVKLINEFVNYIQVKDPDMLVAYNGDMFDFPYLINRMNNLKLDTNNLSRMKGKSYTTKYGAHVFGRVLFDLLPAYKKHFAENRRESYSLDYISKYELGNKGGKVEYEGSLDDLYKTDLDKFLKYNQKDVELIVLLDEKLKIINFFDEIRRMAFCKFEDVFMNSKTADCLCLKYAKKHNFVLPSVKKHEKESYKGGYVKNSDPKLHRNISVLDFKSLYPSIMIGFNTSYETLIENGELNMDNKFRFKKERGIIPSIVKPLLDKRKKIKQEMKELDINKGKLHRLDLTQHALKVIANSFYGVMGFRNFRLYNLKVAESITYFARKIIQESEKWLKENGYNVIYGDTDSVFVSIGDEYLEQFKNTVIKINVYLKNYIEKFGVEKEYNIFDLEFEKIYKTIFFKRKADGKGAKKKYAGRLIWANGKEYDKIDVKGFESRRSDSPQIGRNFLKEVLKRIVYEEKYDNINKFVIDFKNKIINNEFTIEELALPIGISKSLNQYKGNPIHIRASRLANEKHKACIQAGDKIKYIYTKDSDGVIAFKDKMWDGYEIDYDKMIRRIIDLKVGPLFESLGWKYEYTIIKSMKKKKELSYEEQFKQLELW